MHVFSTGRSYPDERGREHPDRGLDRGLLNRTQAAKADVWHETDRAEQGVEYSGDRTGDRGGAG